LVLTYYGTDMSLKAKGKTFKNLQNEEHQKIFVSPFYLHQELSVRDVV